MSAHLFVELGSGHKFRWSAALCVFEHVRVFCSTSRVVIDKRPYFYCRGLLSNPVFVYNIFFGMLWLYSDYIIENTHVHVHVIYFSINLFTSCGNSHINNNTRSTTNIELYIYIRLRPPLWSSGQSFWLQIQRSRVRSPALLDFLSSSGSGTGSTQLLE